jgi:hypothetical protein
MSSIDDTKGALQDYQDTANKIFGPHNLANTGISTLQKGMDELATSSGDTQKSLQGITDILAGLTGKGVSAAQATVDLTTATIDTTKAFAQMTAGALNSKGAIDLSTEAGTGLWNSLKDVSSGYKTAVNDAYNSALATGSATDASKAAGDAAQKLYDKFILTATGAGMTRQAAEDLAKQLGLVPGDVVTTFTTPGLNAAQAGVRILQGQVDVITANPHDVTVKALTADAEQALTAVGVHVTHLPDGTVNISANTYPAQSALDNFLRANASHVITVGIAGTNNAAYTGSNVIVGNRVAANATGGVIHAYAGGGIEAMTAGIAKVVHPNSLRIVGDRVKDDEFYIPDNNDPRSRQIGAEYVRRHPDVAAAALGMGSGASYNQAGTGFTAAAAPGYGTAIPVGGGIDYTRLGQAVAAAMQATGGGRGGALLEMSGPVTIGDQGDANRLAQELNYLARTRWL